jgi:cytochrome b involved in lipid metabolism
MAISYFTILFIGALIYLVITSKSPDTIAKETQQSTPRAASDDEIIVTYKDKKYDVTEFALSHPGGKDVLLENNGKNIEELMDEVGHSKSAYRMLEKYLIK